MDGVSLSRSSSACPTLAPNPPLLLDCGRVARGCEPAQAQGTRGQGAGQLSGEAQDSPDGGWVGLAWAGLGTKDEQ